MFRKRSNASELMDDLTLQTDELRKNLNEIEKLNHWFGSKRLLKTALNTIYKKKLSHFNNQSIVIGDLGCGNGDLLRNIHKWAIKKKIKTDLLGIDNHPYIVQYAKEKSKYFPHIHFETMNIFSHEFKQLKFDIVTLNSVSHHWLDNDLINLMKDLIKQTRFAIIINDLQRHWISYFAIKLLSKLFRFSYLAQHDAPLSILRAFTRKELITLLTLAGITSYQIKWKWAFRWQVIIWCH